MYTYTQLSAADLSLLKQMLQVFGDAFDERHTYQDAVPDEAYLRALLEQRHFIALVAMHGDDVVGGLAAYQLDKFEQDRREIYIYDLAVAEHHRRRGVATGLINELRRLAAARKVYVMYGQADQGDVPAMRLYESFGRREDVHHFDIPVDELTS